jgi:glucosamine--fructose-6-phosphate aminotransferase (isomerizing)
MNYIEKMFNLFKSAKSLGVLAVGSLLLNPFDALGIMGFIGEEAKAVKVIIEGLEGIQNNDYDSAGIAFMSGSEARLLKHVSTPETPALARLRSELLKSSVSSRVGIGHTHISRRGQVSEAKAHPQTDHKNRVYLVHNGSTTNSNELRQFIESRGIKPTTDSNTELLAILIGIFVDDGHPFQVATRLALEKVNGSWGIVAMDKQNPSNLIGVRVLGC